MKSDLAYAPSHFLYILLPDGTTQPAPDLETWLESFEKKGQNLFLVTETSEVYLQTQFLGMKPYLFETTITRKKDFQRLETLTYQTKKEAEIGHQKMVQKYQ